MVNVACNKQVYSVSLLLLYVVALQADRFDPGDIKCDYHFMQKYQQNATTKYDVAEYDSSVSNYCTTEDVPKNVDFTVIQHEENVPTTFLKTSFTPPKRECGYGVALLVDSSVKESDCDDYEFVNVGDIDSKVHTTEKNWCVLRNENNSMKYIDISSKVLHEDTIDLFFSHIFTGCYALRFHLGGQKYVTRGHVFLKTLYQLLEVTEPQLICKYDTYSVTGQRREITNFTLDTSLLADTGTILKVGLVPVTPNKPCIWHGEWPRHTWIVSLVNNVNLLKDSNCSLKEERMVNGEYIKTVQCNFQVQTTTQFTDYCAIYEVIDDRCGKITSRKSDTEASCTWIKRCVNSSENRSYVESTKVIEPSVFLTLPIIAVVLIVSTLVGTLCFFHYIRVRKEEVNLYVNPQHDDFLNPACLKSTDFGIVNSIGTENGIDRNNLACDDIVLLYTKSSPTFMTLMKDFRETLAKICSCSVHDWYDGAEWNDVAKVGAVLWFTELFNSGCRVVWFDTPASRSVVTSNSRESDTNVNKLSIGDFRDVAFPVVLDLAKRNIRSAMHQYRRHFVVRFRGLESTAGGNDPFLDLSPHARYRMPQHLVQLCSDLSVTNTFRVRPILSEYQMKTEEDRLQQRLESLM